MRPWNFSAGPAVLPQEVLQQVAAELTDWQGSGMSVMEMSHRGSQFKQIITEAERDLRTLLAVPEEFAILFTQGGAQAQNRSEERRVGKSVELDGGRITIRKGDEKE